jgi:hypothetical protein
MRDPASTTKPYPLHRDDPLTEIIAKTVIKIAQTGDDPAQLSALAIKQLGVR